MRRTGNVASLRLRYRLLAGAGQGQREGRGACVEEIRVYTCIKIKVVHKGVNSDDVRSMNQEHLFKISISIYADPYISQTTARTMNCHARQSYVRIFNVEA